MSIQTELKIWLQNDWGYIKAGYHFLIDLLPRPSLPKYPIGLIVSNQAGELFTITSRWPAHSSKYRWCYTLDGYVWGHDFVFEKQITELLDEYGPVGEL